MFNHYGNAAGGSLIFFLAFFSSIGHVNFSRFVNCLGENSPEMIARMLSNSIGTIVSTL